MSSGRLSPMDVEQQEFSRKMRGFDPDEVRLFLKSLAEELERLNLEHGNMLEERGEQARQLKELRRHEQTLQKTLVSAQKMADDSRETARAEADLILREARLEAEHLLRDAKERRSDLESEISRLQVERDTFENRLRTIIEQHMTMIELRQQTRQPVGPNVTPMPRTGSKAG